MKKGFTLVELLIVVVVIVTLMAVAFRIGGVGAEATDRAKTVKIMQRLENCLSGYYAAYGSYPPVPLHGKRDYTYKANVLGIQKIRDDDHWAGSLADKDADGNYMHWPSVEAACRSQPVGFAVPYSPRDKNYVENISEILKKKANSSDSRFKAFQKNSALKVGFTALTDNRMVSGLGNKTEWADVQVCKLGLLSYLMPRVLVLFDNKDDKNSGGGYDNAFCDLLEQQRQWYSNNELPEDFDSGQPYDDWMAVKDEMIDRKKRWKITLQHSQMACARWMPNLSGIVTGPAVEDLYGAGIGGGIGVDPDDPNPRIYSANTQQGSDTLTQLYVLREFTVRDSFGGHKGAELYYYSPSPHQTYVLWSSGPNRKTFPPWVPDEELGRLDNDSRKVALEWMSDDIIHMKN